LREWLILFTMERMRRLQAILLWGGLFLVLFFCVELINFSKPYMAEGKLLLERVLHGPELVYPNKQTDLRKFSVVPSQWGDDSIRYVLVVEEQTPVFYKPDSSVKHRQYLYVSKRVCVLFKMPGWAFVGEPDYSAAIGWVSLNSLGFIHQFKPVKQWDFGDFKMIKETVRGRYTVTSSGLFKYSWKAASGGLFLKGESGGQFMEYKSVLWAKKEAGIIWEDFFFTDEQEYFYPEVMVNPKRQAI
jgi:hypothetical protein